jgi:hypothetical protein
MKKYLLFSLIISSKIFAFDLNAILESKNLSTESIIESGNKIILGEFTGAGKSVKLDHVKMFLTKKNVFFKNNVKINYFRRQNPNLVSNIDSLELDHRIIPIEDITGVVVKDL